MIVLDASALVHVLIDQEHKDWVLGQIDGDEILAPSHQLAEVLSALARLGRAGVLRPSEQAKALDEALALSQQFVIPTRSHLHRALALSGRVRVLDGLYVALAEERGCALVTMDRRLARASTGCDIRTPPGSPTPR